MESKDVIDLIHAAFANADNTIIRVEILNQFTGMVDSDVKVFYSKLGKKSWLEFTDEDIEKISETGDVKYYYCEYPMLFILPAFMTKSVSLMEERGIEEGCLVRFYVLYELEAMTATREEFKQKLLETNDTPKDMVEFYLEKDVKGGQMKLEALTGKQKAACSAYLNYVVEKFENVHQTQLEGVQIYSEVESECRRIKVTRDRFQSFIK